jgi:hypothetical protein
MSFVLLKKNRSVYFNIRMKSEMCLIGHYKGKLLYKSSNVDLSTKKKKRKNKRKKFVWSLVNQTNFKKKKLKVEKQLF